MFWWRILPVDDAQEMELDSLFSSPAFGSFASPSFKAMHTKSKRFQLSDDESDDENENDNDDGDENDDSSAENSGSGSRTRAAKCSHIKADTSSFDSSHNLEDSFECQNDNPLHLLHADDVSDNLDGHQQQQLLLRFSCADSLDRTHQTLVPAFKIITTSQAQTLPPSSLPSSS